MVSRKHREYTSRDILTATRERVSFIFDEFEEISVSVSSGKDSTVLLYLALQEAEKRNRMIEVFFLDQEAEYSATVEIIKKQMKLPFVIPKWYQVPIYMTNATSYSDYFLYAWGNGQKWMRKKDPIAIQEVDENHPKRFYEFFPYLEKQNPNKAQLIGLRAEEGIIRYRATTKNPGYKGLKWSTTADAHRFYPLYDWQWNDVWKFIYDYNIPYNKIYDLMFWSNYSMYRMRVSNLIHEKSYKCLIDLPKFEPDTYESLCERIGGVSTAARYASEKLMFSNKQLPTHYKTWLSFRDFLLENVQEPSHKERFRKRFDKQDKDEKTYQRQVGQLLLNDYENSTGSVENTNEMSEKKKIWQKIL